MGERIQEDVELIPWSAVFERLGLPSDQESVSHILMEHTCYPFGRCPEIIDQLKRLPRIR